MNKNLFKSLTFLFYIFWIVGTWFNNYFNESEIEIIVKIVMTFIGTMIAIRCWTSINSWKDAVEKENEQ